MFRRVLSSKPFSIDAGVLLLRLFSGLFMMYYGWKKFTGFEERSASFPDPFHIGSPASLSLTIFGELVCPVFIVLGLFTRLALIPSIITMLVATFYAHAGQPIIEREHAISFLIPYLAIFFIGPGRYSIDALKNK